MRKKFKFIKTADIFIIIISGAAIAAAVFYSCTNGKGKSHLVIETPDAQYIYSLSEDKKITVQGVLGTSEIEISDGKARFISSPCPGKTCIQCPPVKKQGDWTACLPNRVFIRIETDRNQSLDALAQ